MASNVVVDVVVEIVGRPGPYRYRWPESLGTPRLGDEIIVPLQTRRIAAWVISISTEDESPELKEVIRCRRRAVHGGLIQLAMLASRWYVCSPVYFLRKTRSPRVRDAALVSVDRAVGRPAHDGDGVQSGNEVVVSNENARDRVRNAATSDGYAHGEEESWWPPRLAPLDLIWHSMGVSSVETAAGYVRDHPHSAGIVICPTSRQRERLLLALTQAGLQAGDAETDWVEIANGTVKVVVGSRFGAFAPLSEVDYLLVLDPADPSMREQSTPCADGLEVARLRANIEGIRVTVVTAAPPLAVAAHARVYREPFGLESGRWPRFDLVRLAELDPNRGIVGAILDRGLGRDRSRRLAVILPSAGWRGWLRCQACHALQRCPNCNVQLAPLNLDVSHPGLSERLALVRHGMVADAMHCPSCSERFPLRCLKCASRKVAATALSATRVHALLAGAVTAKVELVGGDSDPAPDWQVVVGGYGLLDRIEETSVVALLNVEHFHGVSSLEGLALALYYCNRAASISEQVLVLTDGSDDHLLTGLESRNLRALYRRELASRQRLGLPPSKVIARVDGVRARELVDAQPAALFDGIEVITESDSSCLFVANDSLELHERLAQGTWPTDSRLCRFSFDPVEL